MTVRIPFDDAQDTDLVDLLDRDVLEAHAGWLVSMRGVDYAAQGHVTNVELSDTRAGAVVLGTHPYDGSLQRDTSELVCSCSSQWALRTSSASTSWRWRSRS